VQYYAHVRTSEPDGEPVYQTVTAHLMGTAALCRAFAADFGAANEGEMAGLAHDIGKYTPGFQHRLLWITPQPGQLPVPGKIMD